MLRGGGKGSVCTTLPTPHKQSPTAAFNGLFAAISNRILFGGISKHEGTPIEIATTFAVDVVSLRSETWDNFDIVEQELK